MASRGIRISDDPRFMRAAFDKQAVDNDIELLLKSDRRGDFAAPYSYALQKDNERPYSAWTKKDTVADTIIRKGLAENGQEVSEKLLANLQEYFIYEQLQQNAVNIDPDNVKFEAFLREQFQVIISGPKDLKQFLVYVPENSALRTFEQEGQIQPLGIRGEGLFKLLRVMSTQDKSGLEEVRKNLLCLDWFSDFEVSSDLFSSERSLRIHDRYLDTTLSVFDQKSANEGFLFLLFYFTLFISKETPAFFAIDNIDTSLNPKLCSQLMMELAKLAEDKSKQVVFTTHNPAILDGLDLTDDQQRLFVVSRNRSGHTRVKRVPVPQVTSEQPPTRLSEAFLRGYLGGLPDNF